MPPVSDTMDGSLTVEQPAISLSKAVVDVGAATDTKSETQIPARMIKANNNTVVVVAESVTQRPAAAEARRRRKEILMKQSKQQLASTGSENMVQFKPTTMSTAIIGGGAIVVDDNAVAEAATLAAVAAAAAAAVDASVDLVSTEAINNAVNATTPSGAIDALSQHSTNPEIDASHGAAAAGDIDIPFLDDAVIAATAAAVAMNSVTTSTTTTTTSAISKDITTATKKKPLKRNRPAEKNKIVETVNNTNDPYDDYDVYENDDDYDEDGNPSNNKKTQIRYDPSIPMEKEQLAAWRREARRVRNRESAAASRQRIRGRITELEDELDNWKDKYHSVLFQMQQMQQEYGLPILDVVTDDNNDTTTTKQV